jgi:hypothetical protein
MKHITGILIYISQGFGVILTGEPDEMFCAAAWKYRNSSRFWGSARYIIDNYVWPLTIWTFEDMTHCESCFVAEQKRLNERLKEYENYYIKDSNNSTSL